MSNTILIVKLATNVEHRVAADNISSYVQEGNFCCLFLKSGEQLFLDTTAEALDKALNECYYMVKKC